MKERPKQFDRVDADFRKALFAWQTNPDDDFAAGQLGRVMHDAYLTKRGLTFKIKREVMSLSESRRSISIPDIKRYGKVSRDYFVFNLYPKRSEVGKLKIGIRKWHNGGMGIVDKYNFVFEERSGTTWRTIGIFRPHEIESFEIR